MFLCRPLFWLLTPNFIFLILFQLYASLDFYIGADNLTLCTFFDGNITLVFFLPQPVYSIAYDPTASSSQASYSISLPSILFANSNAHQKLMLTSESQVLLYSASCFPYHISMVLSADFEVAIYRINTTCTWLLFIVWNDDDEIKCGVQVTGPCHLLMLLQ